MECAAGDQSVALQTHQAGLESDGSGMRLPACIRSQVYGKGGVEKPGWSQPQPESAVHMVLVKRKMLHGFQGLLVMQ